MNKHAAADVAASTARLLTKADAALPAFIVGSATSLAIRAGTIFAGHSFATETAVPIPGSGFSAGSDYVVAIDGEGEAHIRAAAAPGDCIAADVLGGFHFVPGGNARARAGGDDQAQINPCSLWDIAFRPACPDPRGMVLVDANGRRFWCDIYLTAADHLSGGTSRFGVTIADGRDPPKNPAGGTFKRFDYETAVAVMAHHGKGLLSVDEFFAAAYGVTEKTAHDGDPEVTKCDPPRTSKFGLMQATGNLWTWGHDGDPDLPRASLFGGSWWDGDSAGSRYADVAGVWPGSSVEVIGARGRSDHLQPV